MALPVRIELNMKKWKLTEAAMAAIPEWNRRWIEIIRRTSPMTADERILVERSIREMYRLANLDGESLRIVFVSSPLMAARVAGSARSFTNGT